LARLARLGAIGAARRGSACPGLAGFGRVFKNSVRLTFSAGAVAGLPRSGAAAVLPAVSPRALATRGRPRCVFAPGKRPVFRSARAGRFASRLGFRPGLRGLRGLAARVLAARVLVARVERRSSGSRGASQARRGLACGEARVLVWAARFGFGLGCAVWLWPGLRGLALAWAARFGFGLGCAVLAWAARFGFGLGRAGFGLRGFWPARVECRSSGSHGASQARRGLACSEARVLAWAARFGFGLGCAVWFWPGLRGLGCAGSAAQPGLAAQLAQRPLPSREPAAALRYAS